jgi:hypothetical protein
MKSKMYLRKIDYKEDEWIKVAQRRFQRQVSMVLACRLGSGFVWYLKKDKNQGG